MNKFYFILVIAIGIFLGKATFALAEICLSTAIRYSERCRECGRESGVHTATCSKVKF